MISLWVSKLSTAVLVNRKYLDYSTQQNPNFKSNPSAFLKFLSLLSLTLAACMNAKYLS